MTKQKRTQAECLIGEIKTYEDSLYRIIASQHIERPVPPESVAYWLNHAGQRDERGRRWTALRVMRAAEANQHLKDGIAFCAPQEPAPLDNSVDILGTLIREMEESSRQDAERARAHREESERILGIKIHCRFP